MSDQASPERIKNSGQEVAKPIGNGKAKLPKTDSRYWGPRLFRNTYQVDGKKEQTLAWCARISRASRRETFNLGTLNREEASRKARDIYLALLSGGWETTLARFKPKGTRPERVATIGEFLAELEATVNFRSSTWRAYVQSLRTITAGVANVTDQPALDDNGQPQKDRRGRIIYMAHRGSHQGGDAWRAKVDSVALSALKDEEVQKWKLAYLAEQGRNPVLAQRAKHTVNSMIRSARSLFSDRKGRLKHLRTKLILPDPLPFRGVMLEDESSKKYVSRVDARTLIGLAKRDLAGVDSRKEQFKIFCLGLLAGLRKREIDTLLWEQVDFESRKIHIHRTPFFEPKSNESEASVDFEPALLALLTDWKEQAKGAFIVETKEAPRYEKASVGYYRCAAHFKLLYEWLKDQGIKDQKPLHTLRKELGSTLANEQGIFAAQQMLRHAHIQTTARFYVDKRSSITSGLGALLSDVT